ncbi:MAG TPA: bifunctional DNA-formamidopyrimidine glycosylase/DNA-(apurinic or apyrimidinic site) lyase [Candidatus Acidoferrales bacterium]|nr:bifunctional DNA-formamidopyrimidine glycosylase/DNA-(apurinic or apyrimidinic site) lyase [Candidatus Acidoferrales bacterium]
MPELPEVETIVRGLRTVLPGHTITSVRLGKTDFIEDPVAVGELLPGRRMEAVDRMGKFIRLKLNATPEAKHPDKHLDLVIHLGMTGWLGVRRPEDPVPPHTHVFFELEDGRELRYTDIRRFGQILLVGHDEIDNFAARLGREPLELLLQEFKARLAGRQARIKALLLNQAVFRGIGNIYADESLWRARIHPARLASRLSSADLQRLWKAIRRVLQQAIEDRGSSISDFVDAEGQPGEYQQKHRAYGREGKRCFRCGARIRRAIVAGRSSYFCPRCQPAPRAPKAILEIPKAKT